MTLAQLFGKSRKIILNDRLEVELAVCYALDSWFQICHLWLTASLLQHEGQMDTAGAIIC